MGRDDITVVLIKETVVGQGHLIPSSASQQQATPTMYIYKSCGALGILNYKHFLPTVVTLCTWSQQGQHQHLTIIQLQIRYSQLHLQLPGQLGVSIGPVQLLLIISFPVGISQLQTTHSNSYSVVYMVIIIIIVYGLYHNLHTITWATSVGVLPCH